MTESRPDTIQAAASAVRTGALTSVGLTSEILNGIGALNEELGPYVTVTCDTARAGAEEADAAFTQGVDAGPLQDIPLAITDIIASKDAPTTRAIQTRYAPGQSSASSPGSICQTGSACAPRTLSC